MNSISNRSLVLPPKRFQSVNDPKYDPLRHRPWFNKLIKRRGKIPMLEMAYKALGLMSQRDAAAQFGVDERELRDYAAFIEGISRAVDVTEIHILNAAYQAYCEHHGMRHINSFIEDTAPLYGVNPRHVTERWEVDANFYPTHYVHK